MDLDVYFSIRSSGMVLLVAFISVTRSVCIIAIDILS
jgi:hypothetical protein